MASPVEASVLSQSGLKAEAFAQPNIAAGRANQNFHFAWFRYPAISGRVEEPECFLIQVKCDCLCFTGGKFDLLRTL